MAKQQDKLAPFLALLAALTTVACSTAPAGAASGGRFGGLKAIEVTGNGVHRFSESIEHSVEQTPMGVIIRSTEIIDLFGDLRGQILYQPVTEIDFTTQKLTNTGNQVFSGTIKDSEPVLLFDDAFFFEVDLVMGTVNGEVFLERTLAGQKTWCELTVTGPIAPPGQDSSFTYEGVCRSRGAPDGVRRDRSALR
ncbi:MAG: hypothetical protein V2I43_19100 [Parvularcula sp.]|jgi:hypothetical protein|nr:hypothetical protein [Parvularcula sp.]